MVGWTRWSSRPPALLEQEQDPMLWALSFGVTSHSRRQPGLVTVGQQRCPQPGWSWERFPRRGPAECPCRSFIGVCISSHFCCPYDFTAVGAGFCRACGNGFWRSISLRAMVYLSGGVSQWNWALHKGPTWRAFLQPLSPSQGEETRHSCS